MTGFELPVVIQNLLATSAINGVGFLIFQHFFLRNNLVTSEFEKFKSQTMMQYAAGLLDRGIIRPIEFAKAKNFVAIAELAEKHGPKVPADPNERKYNLDWFTRFFEEAGNVSDKTVQGLWAKILAGEVNHPSTYSLRTLDVLRNIDTKAAKLFEKVCSHCIKSGNKFFLRDTNGI